MWFVGCWWTEDEDCVIDHCTFLKKAFRTPTIRLVFQQNASYFTPLDRKV
jgi:hypothetical protein